MMTQLLKWETRKINRHGFLKGAMVATFGTLAGLSIGNADASTCTVTCKNNSSSCTGPFGSPYCGSGLCQGWACNNDGYTYCSYYQGQCESGGNCWSSFNNGGNQTCWTCCDCLCSSHQGSFYCYCAGSHG